MSISLSNLISTGVTGFWASTGQTWQQVTRSSNVTYTNSTANPIVVNMALATTTVGVYIDFYVGTQLFNNIAFASSGQSQGFVSFIVPPGQTYKAIYPGSAGWYELR